MLNRELKKQFASLRVEILDLNVLAYFFVKKTNRFVYIFQTTTREYLLEEFIALRYMENGIILHLTNLEDDSSNYSFWEASKELHKTLKNDKQIATIKKSLKEYRTKLKELKNHRNYRIAHLNYDEDVRFDEFLDFEKKFLPLISEANRLADWFWGEKVDVRFRLGSPEGILDFRKDANDLKIDINKVNGFH